MTSAAAEIRYLHESYPKGVETFQIAPGILWARLPLPFRLNHVNVWLLRDADGWTHHRHRLRYGQRSRHMGSACSPARSPKAASTDSIATHGHVDHVGLVRLARREGRRRAVRFDTRRMDGGADPHLGRNEAATSKEVEKFLSGHGCDAATVASYDADRKRTQSMLGRVPASPSRGCATATRSASASATGR